MEQVAVSICTQDLHNLPAPQPAIHRSHQKKAGLPGVLKQAYRPTGGTLQTETARPINTRDEQMVKGKHKKLNNRNQVYLAS